MSPNDEIERLSRSLKSLEPIRLHEEISRVTELSRLASTRIAEVVRVNQQHWQHMIDQTTAVSRSRWDRRRGPSPIPTPARLARGLKS